MDELVEHVIQDIKEYLDSNHKEILFNERDFQMHLAMWLEQSANTYTDVDLEYYIPNRELDSYNWDSELRLDLLVHKDDEYLPIELKYKTKKVVKQLMRFDEMLEDVEVVKNQSAKNLGCYDFWKDVRRLELVRKRFNKVKHGIAVFMTNDKVYKSHINETANSYYFCMGEGKHSVEKKWNNDCKIKEGRPSFTVEKEYEINWKETNYEGINFWYCIVKI